MEFVDPPLVSMRTEYLNLCIYPVHPPGWQNEWLNTSLCLITHRITSSHRIISDYTTGYSHFYGKNLLHVDGNRNYGSY